MKKSFPTKTIFKIFAATLSIASSTAFAENKTESDKTAEKSDVLEAYEVSVMRFGDSVFSVPASSQNITAAQISESGLSSIPDVLRRYADVFFRTSGSNANNAEISLRGFGENSSQRVLVLVDGQRLNRLDIGLQNWQQVPLEEIANIEVLRGPQTSLYGNYAVGGVVKITTKKWNQPDTAKVGGFFGSYGEYSAWGRDAHSADDYYFSADVNYYHNSGYVDYSLNWSKSVGASGGIKLDSQNEITLSANFGNEYISWANPAPSYSDMKDNPTYSSGVSNYNNIDYVTIGTGWENHSAVGEGSAQLGANLRDKDITYPGYGGNNGKLWTVSFTPRYRVLAGRDEESYGEGGVDFYYDTFDIDGSVYKSDLTRATVAPWLGGKIQLDDTFSVSASGRYELAMNDADCTGWSPYSGDENTNGLAAQIGFNARLDDAFNAYFRFDQLYRYPAIDERFSIWNWGPTYINPNLKPERGQNYEMGLNFAKNGYSANASVFYMSLDDEISLNPFLGTTQNIGSTNRFGADVKLGYELDPIGVSTSWTFVSAKFASGPFDGKYVPLVPSIVSSTVFWVKPVDFCRLELAYQWASEQYMGSDFGNAADKMPAVWSVDITANFFICKNVRAFISANNVTGETYALAAYYYTPTSQAWYVAPGRVIRGGIEIRF